jgi:hypothetical protein
MALKEFAVQRASAPSAHQRFKPSPTGRCGPPWSPRRRRSWRRWDDWRTRQSIDWVAAGFAATQSSARVTTIAQERKGHARLLRSWRAASAQRCGRGAARSTTSSPTTAILRIAWFDRHHRQQRRHGRGGRTALLPLRRDALRRRLDADQSALYRADRRCYNRAVLL